MKKYFFSITVFTLSIVSIFAQQNSNQDDIKQLIEKGIEHHDAREFEQAIEKYEEALKIDPTSMIATYEIALSYLAMRDYENASKFSTKVINSNDKDLLAGAYGRSEERRVGKECRYRWSP